MIITILILFMLALIVSAGWFIACMGLGSLFMEISEYLVEESK